MDHAAEIGAVHAPPEDETEHHQADDRHGEDVDQRHAGDVEAAEEAEGVGQVAARRAARPDEGDARQRDHHAQRGDERGNAQIADDEAVDEADQRADAQHQRDDPVGGIGVVAGQHRRADDGERHHGADTEVEATGDDDVERPAREDGERRGALQIVHVALRLHEGGVEQHDGDQQRDQQHIDRIDLQEAAAGRAGRRKGLLGHDTGLLERTA